MHYLKYLHEHICLPVIYARKKNKSLKSRQKNKRVTCGMKSAGSRGHFNTDLMSESRM